MSKRGEHAWVGVKNFGFTEEQKNIEQGSIKLKELHVSCVFKRRWRLGGRKCRKMPESDICVCRKAKVVELHIVCMLKLSFKKKRKKFLILKVWFYENSVKLRQSSTHGRERGRGVGEGV